MKKLTTLCDLVIKEHLIHTFPVYLKLKSPLLIFNKQSILSTSP